MKTCNHYKSTYQNGELITSRCIKLNKNISMVIHCDDCEHHSSIEQPELPDEVLNKEEKPMTRIELFNALSSTLGIIAEQMEEFDVRIRRVEELVLPLE